MRYVSCLITILVILWMSAPESLQGQTSARLICRTEPAIVAVGAEAVLIIAVENITQLYGYEFKMRYSPELIGFVDQDGTKPETNLALGTFLSPDFVVQNRADGTTGVIELALVQLAPSQPKSGSGELARVPFTGRVEGVAPFSLENVITSDPNGLQIPIELQNCSITVGRSDQPTPTPTDTPMPTSTWTTVPSATPVTTATNTPVANSDSATSTPVPPATNTPVPLQPSATPVPTVTEVPLPTVTPTVVISMPTPTDVNGVALDSPGNTLTPVPTETLLPESEIPDPSTAIIRQTGNDGDTANQPVADQRDTEKISASDIAEPATVADVQSIAPTVTSTATIAPLKIAQIGKVAPLPIQSIEQPPTITGNGLIHLSFWGKIALAVAIVLFAGVWYLRR